MFQPRLLQSPIQTSLVGTNKRGNCKRILCLGSVTEWILAGTWVGRVGRIGEECDTFHYIKSSNHCHLANFATEDVGPLMNLNSF
jgi:hypothetical protein